MKKLLTRKSKVVISQICIVFTFIIGMLFNALFVYPILDGEIAGRLTHEMDRYCDFYMFHYDELQNDSAAFGRLYKEFGNYKLHDGRLSKEYFNGDLYILSADKKILFSSLGLTGNIDSIVHNRYGHISKRIIDKENKMANDWNGTIQFDIDSNPFISFFSQDVPYNLYIRNESNYGLIFCYFFEIHEKYNSTTDIYILLLLLFIAGVTLISIVCFRNMKKIHDTSIYENTLETAASIQKAMLPKTSVQYINVDIKAHIEPALKIGGDLYYYKLNNGYLYFCIGDVSGKGIPSALFMSRTITLFKAYVQGELDPDMIVEKMNAELCEYNEQFFFLTAFVGKLRLIDGFLQYCNAGHEAPIYWNGDDNNSACYFDTCGGLPMGFDINSKYQMGNMYLNPNSLLLLYTDGITEAKNSKRHLYGKQRLLTAVNSAKDNTSGVICNTILNSVSTFVASTPQFDDITLLTIRMVKSVRSITIKNNIPSLKEIGKFCHSVLKEYPIESRENIRIRSGLDEAVTNCVYYAYGENEGTIDVYSYYENNEILFKIVDSGIEFNPLEYEKPEQAEIGIGGLGIGMIKEVFDKIKYERTDGKNILYLAKNIK